MKKYKIVLTIAGSDSGGGAGIQADIKTISSLGGFAVCVLTALTAQNTQKVSSIMSVPADFVKEQLISVWDDFHPTVVKIGMLNDVEVAKTVVAFLKEHAGGCKIVTDPVMISTSGCCLAQNNTIDILKNELFPISTIITPNLYEASCLVGHKIKTVEDMKRAAVDLLTMGPNYVLIKGGHLEASKMVDFLSGKNGLCSEFESDRIITNNLHGTGCTLSSAIATYLSFGFEMAEAVLMAKKYITKAIEAGKDIVVGAGNGPLNHFYNPKKMNID